MINQRILNKSWISLGTLDSIQAKDFLPLEQQEREQQENWDWISIKK